MPPDRRSLITELLDYRRPAREVAGDLARVPARGEVINGVLSQAVLASMLARVEQGQIAFSDLVDWAKEVELLSDIDRKAGEEDVIADVLFEMASPEIDDRSEQRRLSEWKARLSGTR